MKEVIEPIVFESDLLKLKMIFRPEKQNVYIAVNSKFSVNVHYNPTLEDIYQLDCGFRELCFGLDYAKTQLYKKAELDRIEKIAKLEAELKELKENVYY